MLENGRCSLSEDLLQEAKDKIHRALEIFEAFGILSHVVGCVASEEGLELHKVCKGDIALEARHVQQVGNESLFAVNVRPYLLKRFTKGLLTMFRG